LVSSVLLSKGILKGFAKLLEIPTQTSRYTIRRTLIDFLIKDSVPIKVVFFLEFFNEIICSIDILNRLLRFCRDFRLEIG
jgi:archaellum component FlaD/FlaE